MNPLPTTLYYMQPQGLGTVEVENLESYITRLAAEHCISVPSMLDFLRGPKNKYQRYKGRLLNRDLLTALLIRATDCKLINLTSLIRWKGVISFGRLYSERRRWCPLCWYDDGANPYERLIWSLRDVTVCLKHEINLSPVGSMIYETPDDNELKWQRFVHQQLSLLLSPLEIPTLPRESFREFMVNMSTVRPWTLMKFNLRHSLNDLILKGWLNDGCVPTLHSALVLAYFLDRPLFELYTSPPDIKEILDARPELYIHNWRTIK